MKHVVLHIGTGKTGTSTIQNSLYRDRDLLRRQFGVDYAEPGLSVIDHYGETIAAHYRLVESLQHEREAELAEIGAYIDSQPADTIIFSCENLYHQLGDKQIERLHSLLAEYRVSIICYVRRQDLYVESAYRQQVKVGVAKATVRGFLSRHMSAAKLTETHANYYRMLLPWRRYFGKESIVVRLFDQAQFVAGDLVQDFLHAAGLDGVRLTKGLDTRSNQAVPAELISVLRVFNAAGVVPKARHQEFVGHLREHFEFADYRMIDDGVRARILENYAESNRRLFEEYGLSGNWSDPEIAQSGAEKKTPRPEAVILATMYYEQWAHRHREATLRRYARRAWYLVHDWVFYAKAVLRSDPVGPNLSRGDYLKLLGKMILRQDFSPSYYARMNLDISTSGLDPLLHYLRYGWRERRIPHPAISEQDAQKIATSVSEGRHPYLCDWTRF